jgi:hypothetical protein
MQILLLLSQELGQCIDYVAMCPWNTSSSQSDVEAPDTTFRHVIREVKTSHKSMLPEQQDYLAELSNNQNDQSTGLQTIYLMYACKPD